MSAVPTAPAVEVMAPSPAVPMSAEDAAYIAKDSASLYETARFLGLAVDDERQRAGSRAHEMAHDYRLRVERVMFDAQGSPRPYDPRELIPRMKNGQWTEIPNFKAVLIRCMPRLVGAMKYPELGCPGVPGVAA